MTKMETPEPGTGIRQPGVDISVVVPFYNAEEHIEDCIRGLLAQDYPPERYEIIMVDNNSTDGSAAIVGRYSRIRLLVERKQGAYAARNRGVSFSTGAILAFTDADCVPSRHWLKTLVAAMRAPDAMLVQGGRLYGAESFALSLLEQYESQRAAYTFSGSVTGIYYGYTNNMAARRHVFRQCGPFLDILRGADSIFVNRVAAQYPSTALRYAHEASVRHLEINSIRKWLGKKYIYGKSFQQNYQERKNTYRVVTRAETFVMLKRTLEQKRHSFAHIAVLILLQRLGELCYSAGRLDGGYRIFLRLRTWIAKARYRLPGGLKRIKSFLYNGSGYRPVYNVNHFDERRHDRRALLLYLFKPFLLDAAGARLTHHQNARQCRQIAELMGKFGYIVDAVDVRDKTSVPSHRYDLIISNRVNLGSIEAYVKRDAVRIFLASVTNHVVHNKSLRERHRFLEQRRGRVVNMRRVYSETMPFVSTADAVAGFGNDFIMQTWRSAFQGPIYSFNNYGFQETSFSLEDKNFAAARRHFLFFASASQVQKGLDLLLEIFPRLPHLQLYVCSGFKNEADFCACYDKELYRTPNVHPLGWIKVNSPQYDQIVRTCAYVILPTCSEGQPGSVVQCMYSGLIPLVTRQAGIDTEDFGVTFANDDLDEIERVVRGVSELPPDWHTERSIQTRKTAEEKYSETAFVNRWQNILNQVLASASANSKAAGGD